VGSPLTFYIYPSNVFTDDADAKHLQTTKKRHSQEKRGIAGKLNAEHQHSKENIKTINEGNHHESKADVAPDT
jgi:hypothetical protein